MSEQHPASLRLRPEPAAPAAARRFAAALLDEWGIPAAKDFGLLLVSELVTNAVLHARTELMIDLVRTERGLHVDVLDDDGAHLPEPTHDPEAALERGRGLLLVESLADRWGCEPCAPGKRLWFELDV